MRAVRPLLALIVALLPIASAAQERPARDSTSGESLPLETTRTVRFTTDEGSWISLDVSPDGSTIVFDLLGDLYTMPMQGGTATPFMTGPAFETMPRYSPSGEEIVFVSDRSGGQNLWIVARDGSDTTQLTQGNGNLYTSPEWAPDGEYLVASRTFSPLGGAAKPWLFHRDGGQGTALVSEPRTLKLVGPSFSPDGRYVYLAEGSGDWTYDALFPEYQVSRYDRDTGERATVTSRYGSAFRPTVSPDGAWLVFGSRHDDATGLRIRHLATGDERWLAFPIQRDDKESRATLDILPGYAFLPDGSAIVMSYGGRIWRVPVDGSEPTPIPFSVDVELQLGPRLDFDYRVEDTPTFRVRQIRDAVPSPSGDRIAFTALGRLYVMPTDGQPVERAADLNGGLSQPAWSPDGETLVVVRWWEPDGGNLYAVPAGGGAVRRVSETPGYFREPAWSPDGSRVVTLRAPVRAGLFGGAGPQTTLVWYPAEGGPHTEITPASGRSAPHFRAADGERIYLFGGSRGLLSLRWDGTDEKTHLKVTGFKRAGATGDAPSASWMQMAPRGSQALARVQNDLYVVTVPRVGTAPTISVTNPDDAPFPVRKVTEIGGEFPTWSSDGGSVHYSLGPVHFVYNLAAAQAYDDSVEAAAARQPEGNETDTAGRDDDDDGYRPREIRVELPATRDMPEGVLALQNARVVTMRGDEVIENGTVVIRNNRIVAVGPTGSVTIPAGAEVKDMNGMTVLPGFVDTHAHLRPARNVHTRQPPGYLANLAFGVTTTRDPQTGTTDVLTYADQVRAGAMVGPRIYSTGPGVFGSYQGETIRDLDHARRVLERYSEYFDTKTFKMYLAGNRQQRQWLLMAARELELMPTTEAGLDFALDLTHAMDGYPGIEHNLPIYPLYQDVVTLFAEAKVVNTPTLIVSFGGPMGEIFWFTSEDVHGNEKLRRFTPHELLDSRTRRRAGAAGAVGWAVRDEFVFDDHARFLRDVVAAGGFAGVGSHGQLQGLGYHWEMWMLASGGMPNHDVLRAATIFGANGIGLEADLGSIEPGKLADLVILSENPLTDIRATTSIRWVMMNGRLHDAETLAEEYPRERALPYGGFPKDDPGGVRSGIRR